MIKRISVYQTADGARFDDEKKAIEHVVDICREALDKRLEPLIKLGHMTKAETFRVVMAVFPDATAAQQFADELARVTISD